MEEDIGDSLSAMLAVHLKIWEILKLFEGLYLLRASESGMATGPLEGGRGGGFINSCGLHDMKSDVRSTGYGYQRKIFGWLSMVKMRIGNGYCFRSQGSQKILSG